MQEYEDFFWTTHEMILEGYAPDHYFFVTISPEQARERMMKRVSMDHFEKNMEFQAKVREGYEQFFAKVPSTSIDGGVELSIMQKEAVRLVKETIGS
jgi:thymidylate kinase